MNFKRVLLSLVFLTMPLLQWAQATPPSLVNYQGVLRSATGAPLTGSYDMTFTFYSASSGGDQILIDSHTGTSQVVVNGGLFTTALGSGTVTDGSGTGTYTSLANAFRDYGTVWLEIAVGGETLNQRIRVASSAYALNADNLDGLDSGAFSLISHNHTGTYLPLAGGTMAGNIAFSGAQTVDGVDLSVGAASWNNHVASTSNVHGLTFTAEGTGGGLDADTVDGLHASDLMGSGTDNWVNATGDTMTGKLTLATNSDTALSANVTSSNTLVWLQNAGSGYPLYVQTTYASATGSIVPAIVGTSNGTSTNGENIGVQGTGQGSATLNYGGKFFGLGNSGTKYGVYGYAGGTNENRAGYFWAKQAGATTNYAVYAEASGATNNYAGYFFGPVSVTGGKLSTAASSTSTAGLNLPHGTFPTTPANGDLWTTTGGLYAQIAGSTVGPFIATSITDHGLLTGLGDDDHTQYFNLSQNETVAGIPAFNGGTGGATAPFFVDSTFLVTNLNADLLDGQHASAFATSGHAHSTLTRGTGLSGSNYDGSAPATFAVVYGTTSSTAVQGNQTATITAGSGLTGGVGADALGDGFSATLTVGAGSGISVAADAVSLGPLTADWNQTGAFDIVLANGLSELKIMESTGSTYYGILNVGDLSADANYWFSGTSGMVLTDANYSAYNLDADTLDGQQGSYYLNTSSTAQTKTGKVVFNASSGDYGVEGTGPTAGAYFKDFDHSGYAYAGYGNYGVYAAGSFTGGRFFDTDSSGYAYLGYGDRGIDARGNVVGGYFKDADGSGYANVGWGDTGIDAHGNTTGGFFSALAGTGYAYVGHGDIGVDGYGDASGSYFQNTDGVGTAYAYLGSRHDFGLGNWYVGIRAYGTYAGGYFKDSGQSGEAFVALDDYGIEAGGAAMGGSFYNNDGADAASARLGYKNSSGYYWGVLGEGLYGGGYFSDKDETGWARVGWWNRGIHAVGSDCGGYFVDTDDGGFAFVGVGEDKILGSGDCNFVQNHPYDDEKVIVYTSLEGDQVATFTRGSARLSNGESHVKLGETFKWVTNPDIGLTAHLTPVGEWADLYVALKTTEEIVVRSLDGKSSAAFDYIIYGLRIGFEEKSPIREKAGLQAFIPSLQSERTRYERFPELRPFNALERFKTMRSELGEPGAPDLSRAIALKESIHEFDPAVDRALWADPEPKCEHAQRRPPPDGAAPTSQPTHPRSSPPRDAARTEKQLMIHADQPGGGFSSSVHNKYERFPVCEPVQEGDVLTNAHEHPGAFCLAKLASDPGVVGIVVAEPPGYDSSQATFDRELGSESAPVATGGVVLCKADATLTPILANDLLVASPIPGHAMKAPRPVEPGTIIGKALEPLASGTGLIKVLVMLR